MYYRTYDVTCKSCFCGLFVFFGEEDVCEKIEERGESGVKEQGEVWQRKEMCSGANVAMGAGCILVGAKAKNKC